MSNDSIPLKRCPRCKNKYPPTKEYFRVCRREKDGLTHACRDCLRKQDAEYLDKNRDKNKENCKNRYKNSPEKVAKYKADNADKIAKAKKDWRKNNPDKVRKHKQDTQKRHPESSNRRVKRYNENHPEIRRMRGRVDAMKRRIKIGNFKHSDLINLYDEQNGHCAYCGISIYWNINGDIHVDHIKPVTKGGTNDLGNLALTCADCNLSKHNMDLEEWIKTRGW